MPVEVRLLYQSDLQTDELNARLVRTYAVYAPPNNALDPSVSGGGGGFDALPVKGDSLVTATGVKLFAHSVSVVGRAGPNVSYVDVVYQRVTWGDIDLFQHDIDNAGSMRAPVRSIKYQLASEAFTIPRWYRRLIVGSDPMSPVPAYGMFPETHIRSSIIATVTLHLRSTETAASAGDLNSNQLYAILFETGRLHNDLFGFIPQDNEQQPLGAALFKGANTSPVGKDHVRVDYTWNIQMPYPNNDGMGLPAEVIDFSTGNDADILAIPEIDPHSSVNAIRNTFQMGGDADIEQEPQYFQTFPIENRPVGNWQNLPGMTP